MQEERWERIYNQLNGAYVPGFCDGVQDQSSMDGALGPPVEQAYEARNRLSERLGVDPASDPDFELLVRGFENFARTCGRLMYEYGYQDGQKAV